MKTFKEAQKLNVVFIKVFSPPLIQQHTAITTSFLTLSMSFFSLYGKIRIQLFAAQGGVAWSNFSKDAINVWASFRPFILRSTQLFCKGCPVVKDWFRTQ